MIPAVIDQPVLGIQGEREKNQKWIASPDLWEIELESDHVKEINGVVVAHLGNGSIDCFHFITTKERKKLQTCGFLHVKGE